VLYTNPLPCVAVGESRPAGDTSPVSLDSERGGQRRYMGRPLVLSCALDLVLRDLVALSDGLLPVVHDGRSCWRRWRRLTATTAPGTAGGPCRDPPPSSPPSSHRRWKVIARRPRCAQNTHLSLFLSLSLSLSPLPFSLSCLVGQSVLRVCQLDCVDHSLRKMPSSSRQGVQVAVLLC
jgi:hypothetical protein